MFSSKRTKRKKTKMFFPSFIQKYSILFKIAQWDFVLLDNKNTIKIFKFLLGINDIFNEGTMIDWLLNSLKSEFQTIRRIRHRNFQSSNWFRGSVIFIWSNSESFLLQFFLRLHFFHSCSIVSYIIRGFSHFNL